MGMVHELKTWPNPFEAVVSGAKRFEIRRDDRKFRVGDLLLLMEWDPQTEQHTGRSMTTRVTYKVEPGCWGLPGWMCVMSIEPYTPEPCEHPNATPIEGATPGDADVAFNCDTCGEDF